MAYNNKAKQAEMMGAGHPADLAEKLMQGNIGKHAGSGTQDVGSALLQGSVKHAILSEPGTSVNQLLMQGGGARGKSKKGKS